ncbi:MAG: hypothetical protein ACOX0K_10695 [Oscillospiraceae bacterium]|jgi:hypothetical protein
MNPDRFTQAQQQLSESFHTLKAVYDNYRADSQSTPKQRGIGDVFRGWLAGSQPTQADARGLAFYDQVAEAVSGLEKILAAYIKELPDLCFSYAKEAAQVVLMLNPRQLPLDIKWYLLAAEYHLIPLLPYLKREELADLCTQYLAATPRRMLLPNQKKLLDQMEQGLSQGLK